VSVLFFLVAGNVQAVEDSWIMNVTLPRQKISRNQLPPGESLCDYCTAKCCHYFAMPIDTPTDRTDFDYLRWFLLHDRATLFTDDDTWYLLVHTTCKHLQPDYRCGIYETRPQICRDYSTDQCEYDDDGVYDRYFETPEQVAEYADAILGPAQGDLRSPRPPLLPVIG
jgi:uncharacterized protein